MSADRKMIEASNDKISSHEGNAGQVFLLMGKEYRISRSIRAQWFFQQFNSILPQPKPQEELLASNEELEILSVLSEESQSPVPSRSKLLRLVPKTHITFIGRKYRFVFCMDISPSLAIVDVQSGSVITDEAFQKFKNCLTGLVAPFSVPGNNVVLCPELYITVLAYTSVMSPEIPQVLIQAILVTEENVDSVLECVYSKLCKLENSTAETVASTRNASSKMQAQKTETDSDSIQTDPVTLMSPEAGPIAMLRSAILALQLLPDNASAGAVVITDGVFALPDASAVDSLLAQLRGSTVCCTFLKVGSGFHAHCSIGYIPHCDLMQFIAMATSGAYLANTPNVLKEANKEGPKGVPVMNLYHKSLLCWSFQRDYDLSKIESWIGDAMDLNEEDLAWPLLNMRSTFSYNLSEWERNAMQPSMHKKQMNSKLHTSITSVISVRLREGYSVQDVSITKGGKQLEVTLTLPWKQHVQIQYIAVSTWPLNRSHGITHIEVTITAPYEFLHDVSYMSKESITSSYRAMVVKKFRQTMKNIESTDELLTHLQSFSSNAIYYTIPDSAKNGVPLFYLPPNSSNPVLSLQHERKSSKSQESQFAVFWKPVLTLDTTVWQRWMHCHRIGLLLEHDIPLPKNLHLPVGNDRFHSIQCRMGLSSLNSLLCTMSSFVLLENHSYIKFIEGDNADSPPSSFCLIRVTSRPPCIVIRLAFLGGTPGAVRHGITKELRSKLLEVTAPIGPVSKVPKVKQESKANTPKSKTKKRVGQRLAEDKPCVLVLRKPLERILVRYERVPEDLFAPYPEALFYSVYSTGSGLQYANRTNENHMKVLCHYMYHQRWVWSVQEDGPRHINTEVVARVLNTLTKLRLYEKFNFASSNSGIITMAKEVELQDPTRKDGKTYSCLVQYVMFPPYSKVTGNAVKEWVDEGKAPSPEMNGKLQMVTEVWVEPQFGVTINVDNPMKYLNGLKYFEIPQAIFEADYKYVSAFLTFERMWCMCDDHIISAPDSSDSMMPLPTLPPSPDRNWTVESVPYPFDVILLLPKARQVEMVFSSLKETEVQETNIQGEIPNEVLFKLLIEEMDRLHDREIELTDKNCQELVKHILERDRMLPVPFQDLLNSCNTEPGNTSDAAGKNSSSNKWRCFVRSVQGLAGNCRIMLTLIPASLKFVKLFGRQSSPYFHDNKSALNSTFREGESFAEKVRDTLMKRALTPIMEDGEKRSPTSPNQDSLQTLTLAPAMTSPNNNDATIKVDDQIDMHLQSVASSSSDSDNANKSVQFKDDDTPTEENLSPVSPYPSITKDKDWFSYNIPIYCYDCPLSNLTHVEEGQECGTKNGESRKRNDIFQNFTQNSQIFVDPFSLEEMPRMSEGRTLGRFGSSKDLLLHCNAIHDIFFRCFVTSTFTSLQSGHQMNVRDVQSAVDTCEENFLEIDITEFIRTLCGHFVRNPGLPKTPSSLRGPSSLLLCQKTQSPIFQRRNFQEFGTLQFLKSYLNDNCESALGLHQSIKDRFMAILGRYFKTMPTFGDLFFYCPQSAAGNTKRKSMSGSFEPEDDQEAFQEERQDDDDKSDAGSEVFGEAVVLIHDNDQDYPLSDDSSSEFGGSGAESDFGDVEDDDTSLNTPLFLQLTCSLRDRSTIGGGSITPVSIDSLPVCIGEIVRRMEEAEESFDLFSPSLHITIDLNCLTLSPLPDYSTLKSSVDHPTFSASFSGSCGESPVSLSPQEKSELKRMDSKTVTSYDIDGLNGPDPLRSLPSQQRLAMNVTCDSIQWLLQDEVVSELRYTGPYTTTTLEKVEQLVRNSEGHPLCIYRNVSLQFVFGAEQSMELFMKEFEAMNTLDYRMNKVDDYYYLTSPNEGNDDTEQTDEEPQSVLNLEDISTPVKTKHSGSSPGLNNDTNRLVSPSEQGAPMLSPTCSSRKSSLPNLDEVQNTSTENKERMNEGSLRTSIGSQVLEETAKSVGKDESANLQITPEVEKEGMADLTTDSQESTKNLNEDVDLKSGKVNIFPDASVDISVPLTVITSGPVLPFCCCDEISTPEAEYDLSTPVEAASTPIKLPNQEECFKSHGKSGLSGLISSSHKSDALSMISPVTVANDGFTERDLQESRNDEEKRKERGSSPRSKKTSPRETKEKLKFWLVLRLCDNCVDIFFHRRHSEDSLMSPTMAGGLIEVVVNDIHENCRTVNQRKLLQDLNDTKMCNSLLFPESDEDIWKHEDLRMSVSPVGVFICKSDSSYIGCYVHGEFIFQPGHFQCSSKWFYHLILHPRLQDPAGNSSRSLGRKIIRNVLDRFGVKNRRDMFVYKETSGNVFYLRLLESLCVCLDHPQFSNDTCLQDLDEPDTQSHYDEISNASQKGSQLSLSQISLTKYDQDQEDDLSEPRSNNKKTSHPYDKVEQSLALHVYGVDEPGAEITVDLLEVLINRLDEATLDELTFMLLRNPKLSYPDVTFIQPADKPATAKLHIVIPPIEIGYLYPLFFYLKQNLLQIFTVPKYADSNRRQHFKDPEAGDDQLSSEIFLYNRPESSGAKGLACISMKFLDSKEEQIHFASARIPSINVEHLDRNFYEDMTKVELLTDETVLDDKFIVEFSIWERGSIGLEHLTNQLKCITQHALCDLLMEYLLLAAPLSSIPEEYFVTQTFRLRSLSAPPTPSDISPLPKALKVDTKTAKGSPQEEIAITPGSETTPPLVTRKISSDSIRSAPCHLRTPSTDSQVMEFKAFHEKQTFKGHRRSKSAEIREKLFKTKKTSSTSKELPVDEDGGMLEPDNIGGDQVLPKPQRKLAFSGVTNPMDKVDTENTNSFPVQVVNNAGVVAKETVEGSPVAMDETLINAVTKDSGATFENAELALRISCEKQAVADREGGHMKAKDCIPGLEETYDTFSQQEILESQEYASTPTTEGSGTSYVPLLTTTTAETTKRVSEENPTQYSSSMQYSTVSLLSPSLRIEQETWQDLEKRRRKIKEKIKKRTQYESGEKGELHPNFHRPGRELFSFAHSLGAPSVFVMEGQLLNRFAIDFMLTELKNLVSSLCPEMTPRIYRQAPECHTGDEDEDHECSCPQYAPDRETLTAQVEEESVVDKPGRLFVHTPGSPCFFVLIARDFNQWRSCLGVENDEDVDDGSQSSMSRGFSGRQRFKALESSLATSRNHDSLSLCSATSCTIPRQKLILLTFIDKKLILYTYNLAADVNQSLEGQIQRLIHWNNARCHLISCLITQKMGLFHHLKFAQINEGKKDKDENPFCMATSDMDVFALISKTAPTLNERDRGSSRSLSAAYLAVFDQVLRDVVPSRPLQRTPYFQHRDPVKRQGYHFREVRAAQIKANTIQAALNDLYMKWQQLPPHVPVGVDKVEILKRSCRLVHYCACPLLFHPDWRAKLSCTTTCQDRASQGSEPLVEREDEWHKNLRCAFIQQYVQYMQSLQFVVVQTRPQSPKHVKGPKKLSRRSNASKTKGEHMTSDYKKQALSRSHSDQGRFHQYLQKTSPGGIMLMELCFQGLYFYVRLYSIDCSRIPSGSSTQQHELRMFLEDCSHYRDYIHLLSFTYDFHLRQAQSYLSGRQMIFNKGYRVNDLLAEILRKHPEYPGFARNHICKGEIAVPCDPVISSMNVFKYIVKHSQQYDFSTITINRTDERDTNFILLGSDSVLSTPRPKDNHRYTNLRDNSEYDITVVVTLENPFEGGVIHLAYFILMTSRRELFPKLSLRVPLAKPPFGSFGGSNGGQNQIEKNDGELKSPRVRFARSVPDASAPHQTKYSPEKRPKKLLITADTQSFHRSASSPHSLNKMVREVSSNLSPLPQSQSDENIAEAKIRLSSSPNSYSSGALSTLDGRSSREVALLNESSNKAYDHLVHVICRAQSHSKRDMLWFRLLSGGTGEEERDTKKLRRKSEFRRPVPDLAAEWSSGIDVAELYKDIGSEGTTSQGLSLDELKLLLSTVVCKSLRNFDKNLVPLLSMNIQWYQGLIRVLISKFAVLYRLFTSTEETGEVQYLVLLNPNELDMFVLVMVDAKDNKTDIQLVFRDESKSDGDTKPEHRLHQKPIKDHIYSVLNAACFHMWGSLLPN